MAEATKSAHQAQVPASMGAAAYTLARYAAIKAPKAALRRQGLRVSHFSQRDLVVRAEAYLADHREELMAEAKLTVERWQAEGFFGAKLNTDAQRRKALNSEGF